MVKHSEDSYCQKLDSGSASQDQSAKFVEVISRSQHNYRELIDNLDQAVFTLSLDGEVRVANRRLCEILGVGFPDLIGHRLDEFIESPTLSSIKGALPSFVETGSWSGTIPVRLKGDGPRYFDCWLQVLAEEGQVVSASGWARDVTAQRESATRFTELFESLREGVFFATLDGRVLDANPTMVQLLGYDSKEDLQAHNLGELYPNPEDRKLAVRELESKGAFRDRETELRRKDGKAIHCLASGFAVRDTSGRIVRLQGTLVDITERREMERKLHQEQEFIRRLLANFPDLIAVFDRDGRFTYVSQSAKDILGGTPEQYIGETLGARTDQDDQQKLALMFQSVISGWESSAQVEIQVQHADGSWKTLRASAGPLFDENGKITGVVASARDVTESKLVEQQLVQKEKFEAMGQVMAGAAHELNNPLAAILGVGELLHERAADDTTKRQLGLVVQQARRAASIVQDLLVFARPPAQRRTQVRLEEIVQHALRLAQPALSEKNIAVTFEAQENLPSIVADPKLLTQAFLNIIDNAAQSISPGSAPGTLKVSLASADDRVIATIADNGPGIPPESKAKIFDPFFTTKRPGGGTGLGLTIALAVAKEHNGTIDVESAPGAGAAFQFILPASAEEWSTGKPPSTSARTAAAASRALYSRTALVVDDEEGIRDVLLVGLSAHGMKVESTGSAEDALALLAKSTYDVVLCDFNLPRQSGEELFEQLKRQKGESLPYFVFMTGELMDSARIAQANQKGAAILQKPFRVPAVVKLLAAILYPQPAKVG